MDIRKLVESKLFEGGEFKDESTVKEGRKPNYPVTLEQYIDVLKDQYAKKGWDYDLPENIANGKYAKACYVYSDIKKNGSWDYRFNKPKWYDREFGNLKKPTDAFQIDWDI